MTIGELKEELSYISLGDDTEVVLRDSQGNEYEIVSVSDEEGKCEIQGF